MIKKKAKVGKIEKDNQNEIMLPADKDGDGVIMTGTGGVLLTTLGKVVGMSRKYSLWPIPFATACCGIEYMSVMASDFDFSRFGAERSSFSPRQADLMIAIGTITNKMAPILKQIYIQMSEPKWVIAMGACASSGGIFDTYSVLQGVGQIIPVDYYVPGCPPRPEAFIYAFNLLQKRVEAQGYKAISPEKLSVQ